MKTALLLVALAAAGCSEGLTSVDSPKVYIGPGVTTEAAVIAMDMWRDAVGVNWIVTQDQSVADVTIVERDDEDACGKHGDRQFLGYDDRGSTQAAICMDFFRTLSHDNPWQARDWAATTIAHELGHVMRMGHIADGVPALMNKGVGSESTITDADKALFRSIWGDLR